MFSVVRTDTKTDSRVKDRKELPLLAGSVVLLFCLDLIFAIAGGFGLESIHRLDEKIIHAWRATNPPDWLVESAINLTALGSAIVLGALSLVLTGYLLLRGKWRSVMLVAVVFGGAYALNSGLKATVGRARPDIVPHLTAVHSRSFPSGHAAVSAAVFLGLASGLARQTTRRREKVYFFATALLLVTTIGLTRVFLGVHYPSDVLAGWTLGALWALAGWYLGGLAKSRLEAWSAASRKSASSD